MSVHGNPNIIEDGLVFMFDSRNKKSYKGEPTENLVPSGDRTGATALHRQSYHQESWSYSLVTNTLGRKDIIKLYINPSGNTSQPYADFGFPAYKSGGSQVGDVYTISFDYYVKKNTNTPSCIIAYQNGYKSPSSASIATFGTETTVDLGDGWKRVTKTATITTAGNTFWRFGLNSNNNETEVYVDNFQVELKSHASPFVDGTRSTTQALIDRTKTATIEFINMSYDSNAHFTFDGTDDYIDLGANLANIVGSNPAGISFAFVAKADNLTNPIGITGDYTGPAGTGFGIKRSSTNNKLEFRCYGAGGRIPKSTTDIPTGSYFHGVCTWDSEGTLKIYFNGTLETTDNGASTTWTHGNGDLRIGDIYGGMGVPGEWQGDIPIFKIYNRVLTDAEVTQSFNAIKSRFGL